MLSSGLFYYTTSRIFLSVCSKSSLLSQVCWFYWKPLSSKRKKRTPPPFFFSFLTTPTPSTFIVRWFATFALSYSFFSLCCGSSLPAPADGKGYGEDQNIRRQQKMWTSSCYINALSENSALSVRNFAVFSILTKWLGTTLVSMRIRIQLFTSMRIQIRIRIRNTDSTWIKSSLYRAKFWTK